MLGAWLIAGVEFQAASVTSVISVATSVEKWLEDAACAGDMFPVVRGTRAVAVVVGKLVTWKEEPPIGDGIADGDCSELVLVVKVVVSVVAVVAVVVVVEVLEWWMTWELVTVPGSVVVGGFPPELEVSVVPDPPATTVIQYALVIGNPY